MHTHTRAHNTPPIRFRLPQMSCCEFVQVPREKPMKGRAVSVDRPACERRSLPTSRDPPPCFSACCTLSLAFYWRSFRPPALLVLLTLFFFFFFFFFFCVGRYVLFPCASVAFLRREYSEHPHLGSILQVGTKPQTLPREDLLMLLVFSLLAHDKQTLVSGIAVDPTLIMSDESR
jgi:hypothetical protein